MPENPDFTAFAEYQTIEDDGANLLQDAINQGWRLVSVGIKRNSHDYENGEFRDEFIYLVGRVAPIE